MGGNALKSPSPRLPAPRYFAVVDFVKTEMAKAFPMVRNEIIPAYRHKQDFGDLDLLVCSCPEYDPFAVARALGAKEVVRNGDVTSIGISQPEGVFQVDLIKAPSQSFDFALSYFAWNDMGNLLGRVAHKAGFKLGHQGLMYVVRNPDNPTHAYGEIPVTHSWLYALNLLGYDTHKYQNIMREGGFESLVDIFRFTVSSRYVNRGIFLLDNRNATSRVRDAKRPSYTKFLAWLETDEGKALDPRFDWQERDSIKAVFLARAFDKFPDFERAHTLAMEKARADNEFRSKFNGEYVQELTSLTGKDLGSLIRKFKESFASPDLFRAYVMGATKDDLDEAILQTKRELELEQRAVQREGA